MESGDNILSNAAQEDLAVLDGYVKDELQSLGIVEPCSNLSSFQPNESIDHELFVLVNCRDM